MLLSLIINTIIFVEILLTVRRFLFAIKTIIFKTIPLQEFKDFLFSKYNINLPHVTFRDVVGRYFRIYGKDNHSEKKPLHSTSSEPAEKAITALEKLFNVFDRIQEYKTVESMKKDKFATFKRQGNLSFCPSQLQQNVSIKKMKGNCKITGSFS